MNDFLQVLLYMAMPALGNFFGGVLAEVFKVSEKTLSLALHTAAGIVLGVTGLELMPQALAAEQPFIPVLAVVAGSVLFVFQDQGIGYV